VVTPLGVGQTLAGTASFQLLGNGVKLKLDVAGCPAGDHAVHLHANSTCANSGGHWANGENIPVITCNDQTMTGSLMFTAPESDGWEVKTNTDNDVAKYVIVIHAINGGAPIACGEINSL